MARSCQAVKILVAWFSETHFLDNQAKKQQIDKYTTMQKHISRLLRTVVGMYDLVQIAN